MRSYTSEEETKLYKDSEYSPYFMPHCHTDKYDNKVSQICFPQFHNDKIVRPGTIYNMVHHNPYPKVRQNDTIYGGRDQFLKFSSYYSDNDCAAHSMEIVTAVGTIYTSFGDGDCLGLDVEEHPILNKDNLPLYAGWDGLKEKLNKDHNYGDNEVLFVLHVMEILRCQDATRDAIYWLNKNTWEQFKTHRMNEAAEYKKKELQRSIELYKTL